MSQTNIAWTDETWNPIAGCSKVDEGCKHCYAEVMANRLSKIASTKAMYEDTIKDGKWTGTVMFDAAKLSYPLNKRKGKTIFVGSMSDIFHENNSDEVIDEIFHIMMRANWHTYILLTKRPKRMKAYIDGLRKEGSKRLATTQYMPPLSFVEIGGVRKVENVLAWHGRDFEEDAQKFINGSSCEGAFANVWFGTSIENQEMVEVRLPHLLDTKVSNRMLSIEPLLSRVDIDPFLQKNKLKWVIVGGESGKGARAMHPLWVEKIYKDCKETNTSFFFKQWGAWKPTRQTIEKDGLQEVHYSKSDTAVGKSCFMINKKEYAEIKDYPYVHITDIPKLQGGH